MKNKWKWLSNSRKRKSKTEPIVEKKVPKKTFSKLLTRIKESLKKYPEQIKAIKKFLLIILGYGVIINYTLYIFFQTKFNIFSLFAWGIAYYFISDEFVEWFRRLIAKR